MLEFINRYILGAAVPVLLCGAGIFFSLKLKLFYLLCPRLCVSAMCERERGEGMSPLRAVMLALAGTLGVGNIVGVASAIYLGGVGSVFWMWISALLAMILKYAEAVLAICHRKTGRDGEYHGGAMNYIKAAFSGIIGKGAAGGLALLFALLCIVNSLSMGCVIQVNAISRAHLGVFGINTALCGAVLAILTLAAITRGGGGIAAISGRLVPLMTLLYIIMSLAVMFIRRDALGGAFISIFEDAFSFRSASGGVAGFLLSRALRFGTMRGLMSNEAGCGTAPIAHCASSASEPAKQGLFGIFEVFVDTLLLCTMTALVIIISLDEVSVYGGDPIFMTLRAYAAVLGDWALYPMCISVLFFGFATVICWAHYGMECLRYLTGNVYLRRAFIAIYTAFVFVGAVSAPEAVWGVADFALGAMTVINVTALCLLSGQVAEETNNFICRQKKKRKGLLK